MYAADLKHDNSALKDKLQQLYTLNRHTKIDLSFRPPYLKLLENFGNPHLKLPPVIHVAGTNGKGSTIAIMRSILEAEGYKVHAYTSPHLHQFNERIYLAGQNITDKALEALIDEALELNQNNECTFFEITTAIAFAAFAHTPADVTLLEVGMGGRLDCTNVIEKPIATIINIISLDHTQHLGETLLDIAKEKAGIIKSDVPCIIGKQSSPAIDAGVLDLIKTRAESLNSPTHTYGSDWLIESHGSKMHFSSQNKEHILPQTNLTGKHQTYNAGLAIETILAVKKKLPVSKKNLIKSLNRIEWPARLQEIHKGSHASNIELWLDGGHNDSAGAALAVQASQWQKENDKPLHIILGMKTDKNVEKFLTPLLPYMSSLSLIPIPDIPDTVKISDISALLEAESIPFCDKSKTIKQALKAISTNNKEPVRVLICGSLYLAEQLAD